MAPIFASNQQTGLLLSFHPLLLAADARGGRWNNVLIITWGDGFFFFSFSCSSPVKQLRVSAVSGSPWRSLTRGDVEVTWAALAVCPLSRRDKWAPWWIRSSLRACVRARAGRWYIFRYYVKLNCIHLAWHFSKVIAQQFSPTQSGVIEFRPLFCPGPSVDYLQSMQITGATGLELQRCSFPAETIRRRRVGDQLQDVEREFCGRCAESESSFCFHSHIYFLFFWKKTIIA